MGLVALLAGCASGPVDKPDNRIAAELAQREIPAEQLLNINIVEFDPNVPAPANQDKDLPVVPAVRKAEASYLAYTLRSTLEGTGQWGAVRVVPDGIDSSEISVHGTILVSDGETLEIRISAADATGRVWLEKTYARQASEDSYADSVGGGDPYQSLFNQIANDLLAQRRRLDAAAVLEVRRVAELRFAADIAPDAFSHHLEQSHGRYRVRSLPANDDPMLARIAQIRERDNLLIDSLDQHYGIFHDGMAPAYRQWRLSSFKEGSAMRELKREATMRKVAGGLAVLAGIAGLAQKNQSNASSVGSQVAILGGGYLFKTGIDKGRDAQIHVQALQELNTTLGGDLEPRVVSLEGQTVTLHGSAKEQYREWRRLLRELHQVETGATGN
ncbi:MAG: hypothetical protein COW59_09980 [Lysobacterales bacterium CG17_big_fil_post_rev_8_21_14_2_50_64_11]|nr:MAG: hypothetical protein COW59_09980 [Xanthomonadales bacterium CG17_big_fil_post_rev_8_21_14_2_50_64_11]